VADLLVRGRRLGGPLNGIRNRASRTWTSGAGQETRPTILFTSGKTKCNWLIGRVNWRARRCQELSPQILIGLINPILARRREGVDRDAIFKRLGGMEYMRWDE
jgi:hypothetical protein